MIIIAVSQFVSDVKRTNYFSDSVLTLVTLCFNIASSCMPQQHEKSDQTLFRWTIAITLINVHSIHIF